MYSLFKIKFNWILFLGFAFYLRIVFIDMSWFSYIAILLFIHQFILLFYSINYVLPIRYIFGVFMCLQMLLGPAFAYNGLDDYQFIFYKMQIPEEKYFSYAIPGVIAFILGLHITAGKLKGEVLDEKKLQSFIDRNETLSYIFVSVGFVTSYIFEYFSLGLGFVLVLLSNLKYVGAFMIILSNKQLKLFPLIVVLGSVIFSSLGNGMFHDLLTWIIMLGAVFAIKKKPSLQLKLIVAASFILLAITLQLIKTTYRKAINTERQEGGLSTLTQAVDEEKGGSQFFDLNKIASSNVRINQGFIITYIMRTVPNQVPYANGEELYKIVEAAVLPRILAPNKLEAGEKVLFNKYSGIQLNATTSMGLSSLGDAYINYGVTGGCIFMFVLGLFYNIILKEIQKYSRYYPVLILFTPFIFIYSIRPDCELQTSLGFVVKSIFIIFIMLQFWKGSFKVHPKIAT